MYTSKVSNADYLLTPLSSSEPQSSSDVLSIPFSSEVFILALLKAKLFDNCFSIVSGFKGGSDDEREASFFDILDDFKDLSAP